MKSFLLGLLVVFWSYSASGQTLYTFNGGGTTGDWNTASSWTNDPTGSTSVAPRIPTSSDNVVVTNSYVLTLGTTLAAGATPASITVQRGGVLDLTTSASGFSGTLARLAGQGTLRIGRPYFPSVATNDFDDANTGTVEYYNWPAGPTALPTAPAQYNNLRFLNTSTTTPAYVVQLDNNLTVAGNLVLTRTNTNTAAVTLNIGKTASTSRTLNVLGDITIGAGTALGVTAGSNPATATAPATPWHVLNVSGSFVNNGTVNLFGSSTQTALLNFTSASDANFACNGATDLGILQVDKGFDSQALLNVTSGPGINGSNGNLRLNSTAAGDILVLKNGITKLGNNVYLTKIHNGNPSNLQDASGWYQLGSPTSSPTLWLNGATVLNDNADLFVVYGIYRISGGKLSTENDGGMVIREDAQVLIEGGTTIVNKFRPSSTAATHRGSFTMTGGLFQSTGKYVASTFDDNFSRFSLPYTTQAFRMSGGIIEVSKPNVGDGFFHVGVNPNNATVTGGTIRLFLPDNTSTTDCKILSTAPLWNLSISRSAAGTSKAVLASITNPTFPNGTTTAIQPLTVLNDFSLGTLSNVPVTFDAAGQTLTIQGSFNIGTAANTGCVYQLNGTTTNGNTTVFSGGQNQQLSNYGSIGATAGASTFSNWTIDKSAGTLVLGGTVMTYGVAANSTLSLLNGVLNDGGKTINVLGNMVNSASHTSGGGTGSITMAGSALQTISGNDRGVFGNLTIASNMTVGTTPVVAVTMTANMSVSNTLDFANKHILAIGANRLSLTNVSASTAITSGNGFDNFNFVQTAGNQSDLGLQKTYGGGDNFIFPVGTGTKYAPATVQLQLASGATLDRFGQVSVSPVNAKSPFVTTANALKYYWKVRSVGFGTIPASSINMAFRLTATDIVGTRANYVPGRYIPVAWAQPSGSVGTGSPNANINFSSMSQFEGEFTAGEPAAFGAVTAYYSIKTGDWGAASTWSTVSNAATTSNVSTPPAANNPVFIGSSTAAHTVTVRANGATAGSLVIDRRSVLDVGAFTGHNFGALPDSKVGGSGKLRITTAAAATTTAVFPGGDFGSFIDTNGGTVEYYTNGFSFAVPTTATTTGSTLNLVSYRNLNLNAQSGQTITLPNQNLRVYANMKAGAAGYTGTVLLNNGTAGNLRVDSLLAVQAGVLRLQNTNARTLTLDTDLRVDAGATFDVLNNAALTHNVTIGGSFTNNGTLDFNVGTGKAALTFTGSADAKLTGPTGVVTDLYTLTINKGLGRTATLNLDVAGTLTTPSNPTGNWLTLTNGTLRYAKGTGTLTIHDEASTYLIPENAGLTVDASGATVTVATNTSTAADLKLAGEVRVLQGTLNVGTAAGLGNDLEYASAGAPTLRVANGGTLYVNGQVRRTVNNLDGSLRYDQSGGTVTVDGFGASAAQSNERGLFEVQGVGSIFRMSAGTLNLRRSNGKPTFTADLYLTPDSTVVTGGTVLLGHPAGTANATVSVNSKVPLYDVQVATAANTAITNTGLLTGLNSLNLKGSLTIGTTVGNTSSFFNANGLGLNIDQNLINNNTSASPLLNVGGFQPFTATQTTTFTGKGPSAVQQLTSAAGNLTVFGGLVVNNAQANGALQLGGNARVAGTLTLTKGTLDDNGNTITAVGDVLNSAVHSSTGAGSLTLEGTTNQNIGGNGLGKFGNVTLKNGAGVTTTTNQEITKVLTLNTGVFTIGSNLLLLSNTAANAVAGASTTSFIRTNGIVADLGVSKSYPTGASDFTFPIGAASKYTPVRMNVTSNTAAGTLTVQPIDLAHPSTTDVAAKELGYYWKVRSTGFNNPVVTQVFTYADNGVGNDVNGTETAYKLGRFLNGAWIPQGGISTAGSGVNATANTLTNASATYFDGDYTGGETSEFGAVPTFYSRTATAGAGGATWTDAQAWTFTPDGSGPSAGAVPTLANPVVIHPGHVINSGSNGQGAASLVLNGTLDLATNLANNFSTVSGTGTLRIGSAIFPAGNYAAFVAANTGTVDFTGAVQLPARDTYNNLTFSGSNAKQLSNLDLTINGTLTVATGASVTNPTSQGITLTSGTSGATIAGTVNLNDGTLKTGAFLTNSGTLSLGAGEVSIGTTLTNSGTLNNGNGALTVGTAFANSGTYNAKAGTGDLTVGTTFTNSNSYTAGTGKLIVGDNFSNTGTFTAASGDVTTIGNFSNSGTYNGSSNFVRITGDFSNQGNGVFYSDFSNLVLRGNFTNSAPAYFDAGSSTAQFITTDGPRVLTGATDFYNLQKVGIHALTLGTGANVTVANILNLRSGLINTGTSNILKLSNTSTQPIIGTGPGAYVAGRLAMALPNEAASIRVFPVGAGGRYRPVTIKPQGTSASPVVLVEIFNGAPAGNPDQTLSNLSANRYYSIQLLSGTINQPTVQLSFNTDVADEQVNVPGNLRVAKATGPITSATSWGTAGGGGVYSPEAPRGYTISAPTIIDGNSFFALASTNKVDNPLTGSAPLPVELVQFTAVRQGSAVAVAWATATERNSAYFQVQRSADGRTFSNVERVEAKGNSNVRHNYATLDAQPLAGLSYYRLRQVDRDGKEAYSPVATVRFDGQPMAPALAAYPNPASGQGFQLLATNLATTGGTVQVFDNVGRLVLTQVAAMGSVETTIQPTRPLASGMYFVTWQTTDGVKLTTKVSVE